MKGHMQSSRALVMRDAKENHSEMPSMGENKRTDNTKCWVGRESQRNFHIVQAEMQRGGVV